MNLILACTLSVLAGVFLMAMLIAAFYIIAATGLDD